MKEPETPKFSKSAPSQVLGKKTHIKIQKLGDCPGTGWVAKFVYMCFFGGRVVPYGGENA